MLQLFIAEFEIFKNALGTSAPNVADPFDVESPVIRDLLVNRMRDRGYSMQVPPEGRSWGTCATARIGRCIVTLLVEQLSEDTVLNGFRVTVHGHLTRSVKDLIAGRDTREKARLEVQSYLNTLHDQLIEIVEAAGGSFMKQDFGRAAVKTGRVFDLS